VGLGDHNTVCRTLSNQRQKCYMPDLMMSYAHLPWLYFNGISFINNYPRSNCRLPMTTKQSHYCKMGSFGCWGRRTGSHQDFFTIIEFSDISSTTVPSKLVYYEVSLGIWEKFEGISQQLSTINKYTRQSLWNR
jgi:hypothetical protein